jgi:hypothetical protein
LQPFQYLYHWKLAHFLFFSCVLFIHIGFNRKKNEGKERLFEVIYAIQNGEEFESSEKLTYAQVQQGRGWYKQYCKDNVKKSKMAESLRKAEAMNKSKDAYAELQQGAEDEMVRMDAITDDDNQHTTTPARCTSSSGSSSTSSTSTTSSRISTCQSSGAKRLHNLSVDEVSELMTSINMSKELIASFLKQQVDGSTLAMISTIDELENDYLNDLGMKRAKVKVLWTNILRYQHNNFD